MATFTVRPEGIIRQPALTMPGNATGSEAACTALTGSQIRAICGLGTTDNVTFNTVTATTSVLTTLLNNTNAAALILGNSTYGISVPGNATISGGRIYGSHPACFIDLYNPSTGQLVIEGNSNQGSPYGDVVIRTAAADRVRVSATTGATTFSGDISMSKTSAQGYIRAYGTGGVNNIAMYDDNTNGIVSTSSGALVLSSATSIIGIGGITSAYPAIKRSSTTAAFRLGDDSADAPISCAGITASGVIKTNYPSLTTPAVQVETTGGAEWGMGYYSGNLIFYTGATLGAVLTATEMRLKSTMKFSWSSATDNLAGADVTLSRSGSRIVASGGVTATAGSLNSGGTVQNSAVGVCDLVSAAANPCSVVFSENGVANRGSFGFAAGSSTLSYRAGGTSMTTGTEVFTITSAGSLTHTGGQQTGYVAKTANYTTTADDHLVNVTANSIDITLETAVGCAGRIHEIINTGSGTVTMKTTSAQTISGSASGALTLAQWKSMTVKSNGANWLIISQIT